MEGGPGGRERRRQAERLFEEALELPRAGRGPWLDAVRVDDPALGAEVAALLRAHERPDGILDRPVPAEPGRGRPAGPAPLEERIGAWRPVAELGRGGMGVVYLAERADGQFRQRAALKVIRGGPAAAELRRRFEAERQILASLEHPHIARLLDGGVTEDGRPYLVMEYVEGLPIDVHCSRHGLELEARLRLFCRVARAVHHAHRSLVVHRDLKPSNILIRTDGTPKLLDFGIAKVLGPGAPGWDGGRTLNFVRPMTPEYASPEQVRGDPVTTATDVYSLGAVLYELLAGRTPLELGGESLAEAERRIVERDPPLPSEAAATPWRRRLRGDLDRIALMALRKEPERRYTSAEQLAEDVGRHLTGHPVVARGDSRRYRLGKLLRRHRTEATAAAGVAVALLAGSGLALWQAAEASRQRDEAEAARGVAEAALARSEDVTAFLVDLFRSSDPREAGADTVVARALLRRGLERAELLGSQPVVQARVLDVLGQVYEHLGRFGQAMPLLERGLALRREHLGESHPDVAESLLHLASAHFQAGQGGPVDSLRRRALEIQRAAHGDRHPAVATAMTELGRGVPGGDLDAAEALLREAVAILEEVHGPGHPDLMEPMWPLITVLVWKGEREEAEGLARRLLAIERDALGTHHPSTARAMIRLGDFLARKPGSEDEAEELYRAARLIQRETLAPGNPAPLHGINSLAALRARRGDLEEAMSLYEEAVRLLEDAYGPDHRGTLESRGQVGRLLVGLGRLGEADRTLRPALERARTALGHDDRVTAFLAAQVAELLAARGERPEGERLLRQAIAVYRTTYGERSREYGELLASLGRMQTESGDGTAGRRTLERALEILGDHYDESDPEIRAIHRDLGVLPTG